MPFYNEKPGHAAIIRILSSKKVEALQSRLKHAPTDDRFTEESENLIKAQSSTEQHVPKIILAIDGSYHTTPIKNGYPGAEIGYLTIASVLLILDRLKMADEDGIINPVKFRKATEKGSIDIVIPGRGVVIDDELSAKYSMRKTLFEEMQNYRVLNEMGETNEQGETLLDTYEHLMDIHAQEEMQERPPTCPCEDDDYQRGKGCYECSICHLPLYSTDAMRCHELFSDIDSCDKMYGQIMSVMERLLLIHILRAFEKQGETWLSIISDMAFFIDGPLAVYGTSAWLSKPIRTELGRLNEVQKKYTNCDLLILSIEKTGNFVNHLEMLDTDEKGNLGKFPKQHYQLIDNDYIRKHIVPSYDKRLYGRNTYFGRKLFYKTQYGHRLVVNLACYNHEQINIKTAEPWQYARLNDALGLLDAVSSSMYPNSISPLIAAHTEASIPLNLGREVLDKIAKERIKS